MPQKFFTAQMISFARRVLNQSSPPKSLVFARRFCATRRAISHIFFSLAATGFGFSHVVVGVQAAAPFADDIEIYDGPATTVQWGDLDKDGLQDLFIAEGGKHGRKQPVLSWFKAPASGNTWQQYSVGTNLTRFTGDSALVDVDGDNDLDIIIPRDDHGDRNPPGSMQWYENPGNLAQTPAQNWPKHIIETNVPDAFHQGDLEVADVDGDGKLDIVVRSLGVNRFVVYFQGNNPKLESDWQKVRIDSPYPREGLVLGDLDGDNKADIVGNGFILFAPANPRACTDSNLGDGIDRCMATWPQKIFDANYFNAPQSGLNNSTKGELRDMDGDGRPDILQSSAEGNTVYLAWFKNPQNARTGNWSRTIIEDQQGKNHNVQVGDVDLDGDLDVLGGFSFGAKGVYWWENTVGNASTWVRRTISTGNGCYSCVAADYDNDGDIDFAGPTRYTGNTYLYKNTAADNANILNASPGSLQFASTGGAQALSIQSRRLSDNAPLNWSASSDQAWVTLSATSGNGDQTINVTTPDRTAEIGNRSATVTVTNGSISRSVQVIQAGQVDTQAPSTPSNVQSNNVSFSAFDLSWQAATDNSGTVAEYVIYLNGSEVRRVQSTSATITGLTDNTVYDVRIAAVDGSGNISAQSDLLQVTTNSRPPSPPPFAQWSMDDGNGSIASDSQGSNDGNFDGLTSDQWSYNNAFLGSHALRFDGGNEKLGLGTMNAPQNQLTMIGWVRPSNIAANSGEGRIISKASGSQEGQHYWMLSTDENGSTIVPRVRLRTGSKTSTLLGNTNAPVTNGQWQMIAATYDGSSLDLYLDGNLVGTRAVSGNIAQSASVPAVIGNQPQGGRGFEGLIDEVCLFDFALTAQDIGFLYNDRAGRTCDTLVSGSNPDVTAPELTEVNPVAAVTTDQSPGYTFFTNEAGTASFSGSCFDNEPNVELSSGDYSFSFISLAYAVYSDCQIVVTDAAGNASQPLQISQFEVREPDTTRPSVMINRSSGQSETTSSNLARFDIVFDEPINASTLTVDDIHMTGTTGSITNGPIGSNNNQRFSISITGMTSGDLATVNLPADRVFDLAGNGNTANSGGSNSMMYVCDNCDIVDGDEDGVDDSVDNCPEESNPDQRDSNGDGVGDVCTVDDDVCFVVTLNKSAKKSAVAICL